MKIRFLNNIKFLVIIQLLFAACFVRLYADSGPGMIGLDPDYSKGNIEVYLPDPILLVHGVGSNIQTYAKAMPTLYPLFWDGNAGSGILKYDYASNQNVPKEYQHYYVTPSPRLF